MTEINSSAIRATDYNKIRQDLTINFKSGKKYIYTPVSEEFYLKFKNSVSRGRYFNDNIKNNEALTCLKVIK